MWDPQHLTAVKPYVKLDLWSMSVTFPILISFGRKREPSNPSFKWRNRSSASLFFSSYSEKLEHLAACCNPVILGLNASPYDRYTKFKSKHHLMATASSKGKSALRIVLKSQRKNINVSIQQDTESATLFLNSTAESTTPSEADPKHRK